MYVVALRCLNLGVDIGQALTFPDLNDCIVLLFYVHSEHLRSCRDSQLT